MGDGGRLLWRGGEADAQTGEVLVQRWGEALAPVPLPTLGAVDRAASLDAFRVAVEGGREPETSGRDNLRSLAIVVAMVESIERGTVVEVAVGQGARGTLRGDDRTTARAREDTT